MSAPTPLENFVTNTHNDGHPEYDEDAAMCSCGHSFREHCGRALDYQCALTQCECSAFRGDGVRL